jgi:hypothetical protein
MSNPLKDSGKPLFFRVANPEETGLAAMQKEALVVSGRTALDMAEQTCVLHAFCRTDLKARVKITRPARAAWDGP